MADKFLTKGSEIRWSSNPSNNVLYRDNDLIRFYTNKQSKYALVNDGNIRYKKQNIGNPSGPVEHINGEYRVRQFIYTKFTPDEIKPYLDKISSGELTIRYNDAYSYMYPRQLYFTKDYTGYRRYSGLCIDRQSGILYGFPYKSGNMRIHLYSPISKKNVSELNIKIIVGNPVTESEIGTKYFLLSPWLLTSNYRNDHYNNRKIVNMSLLDPDGRELRCLSMNDIDLNFFSDSTASELGKYLYGKYSYVEKGSKFTISINFDRDLIETYISELINDPANGIHTREAALEYLFGKSYKGYGYFGIMSTNDKTKIPDLSNSKRYKEFIKKIHLNDVLIKELITNNHKHIIFECVNRDTGHYPGYTFSQYPPENYDDDWKNA